jgi:hypothetical protein
VFETEDRTTKKLVRRPVNASLTIECSASGHPPPVAEVKKAF